MNSANQPNVFLIHYTNIIECRILSENNGSLVLEENDDSICYIKPKRKYTKKIHKIFNSYFEAYNKLYSSLNISLKKQIQFYEQAIKSIDEKRIGVEQYDADILKLDNLDERYKADLKSIQQEEILNDNEVWLAPINNISKSSNPLQKIILEKIRVPVILNSYSFCADVKFLDANGNGISVNNMIIRHEQIFDSKRQAIKYLRIQIKKNKDILTENKNTLIYHINFERQRIQRLNQMTIDKFNHTITKITNTMNNKIN